MPSLFLSYNKGREVVDLKAQTKRLLICLAVPLAVGGIAALLTGGGMDAFEALQKPPLSPPGWLFPVVWTALYLLMGIASYLALNSGKPEVEIHRAMIIYAVQLAFNFIWPLLLLLLIRFLLTAICSRCLLSTRKSAYCASGM